jgi:2-polyprenyl-6-methoxyphenol hydroxylase-like FAD-dependent oxidoreductase
MADAAADVRQTTCCIVGAGPGGAMLALLLARWGIDVTLLEAHKDFDRDFRGDTIHPSTLEIIDQLGLDKGLLQIPHGKVRRLQVISAQGATTVADFGCLKTSYPYIMMLPQVRFLEFITQESARYPSFHLILGANVQRLVERDGVTHGVRFRGADDAWHEIHAPLTVGADGRFSKVRALAGVEPIKTSPPMDVVWFRLPRKPEDPHDAAQAHVGGGHLAILLDRGNEWQVGYAILKGSYHELHAGGVEALRRSLVERIPWLADRVEHLRDWHQVAVLSVESSRVPKWYQPGLLLIGDAAHVMSPVGGVGINYAIQDAVEAANLLAGPLKKGKVRLEDLAAVQRRREWPTRVIQSFQEFIQKSIVASALDDKATFRIPLAIRILLRLPYFRNLPARLIALGVHRVTVKDAPDSAFSP